MMFQEGSEIEMKNFTSEADARIVIDDFLRQAGWDPADKSQVLTEVHVRDHSHARARANIRVRQ